MVAHGSLEHVSLLAVELRHALGVDFEPAVVPGVEDGECDGLGQGRRLETGHGGLSYGGEINARRNGAAREGIGGRRTCMSMAVMRGSGPHMNPILIPADMIFDKLSNRRTLPT